MKTQSVVNLDPIDRQRRKQDGVVSRLLKTKHCGGKPLSRTDPIGHYMFCGRQRSGKTVSAIWYAEQLIKKYKKQGKKIILYSNLNLGVPVNRATLFPIISRIRYDENVIHIFIIDEIQSYFPKDTKDQFTLKMIDDLTGVFSQLGKNQIYVLSTAQVYGRLNKNLREQCFYMVYCRPSRITHKTVNDFIDGDDIMCDELGRWSGIPVKIYTHGLPEMDFDTHRMILE